MKNKKNSKENKNVVRTGFWIVGIISTLALLLGVGAFVMPTTYGDWECIQTTCSKFMTEEEIEASVCAQTEEGLLCSLNVDGNITVLPREQLNFTSLQFCKEEVCIKEIKTRSANYTFKKE